jgi:uncharacterized protein (TIGR03067 family)
VEIKGEKFRVIYDNGAELKGTFKIDATTDPKIIDFSILNRGAFEGIYKFDGDVLTICISEVDVKQRPAEFAKDGKNMGVLKRVKE